MFAVAGGRRSWSQFLFRSYSCTLLEGGVNATCGRGRTPHSRYDARIRSFAALTDIGTFACKVRRESAKTVEDDVALRIVFPFTLANRLWIRGRHLNPSGSEGVLTQDIAKPKHVEVTYR